MCGAAIRPHPSSRYKWVDQSAELRLKAVTLCSVRLNPVHTLGSGEPMWDDSKSTSRLYWLYIHFKWAEYGSWSDIKRLFNNSSELIRRTCIDRDAVHEKWCTLSAQKWNEASFTRLGQTKKENLSISSEHCKPSVWIYCKFTLLFHTSTVKWYMYTWRPCLWVISCCLVCTCCLSLCETHQSIKYEKYNLLPRRDWSIIH